MKETQKEFGCQQTPSLPVLFLSIRLSLRHIWRNKAASKKNGDRIYHGTKKKKKKRRKGIIVRSFQSLRRGKSAD